MTYTAPLDDPEINAIREALDALGDDELAESISLNVRITPGPDSPEEIRRDHFLRQQLAREILHSRRAAVPIKWPKCATAEDYAAGKRTICQHVDVPQPDGSIARLHCRVVDESHPPVRPNAKVPGPLARIWNKVFRNDRTPFEDYLRTLGPLD